MLHIYTHPSQCDLPNRVISAEKAKAFAESHGMDYMYAYYLMVLQITVQGGKC